MATTKTQITAMRAKGGSFLIEDRQPDDIFTPEDFSDEHRQIAKTAVEFTTNEVMPAAADIEAMDIIHQAAELLKTRRAG